SQAEDGIRDRNVTGVQTCALPICLCRLLLNFGNLDFPLKKALYALSKFNCALANASESTSFSHSYSFLYLAWVGCFAYFYASLSFHWFSYVFFFFSIILLCNSHLIPIIFFLL